MALLPSHSSGGDEDAAALADIALARTFVSLDREVPIRVLTPTQASTLVAWAATLIPGDGDWPSAAEVRVAEYVEETLIQAPVLRPIVLEPIDQASSRANEDGTIGFLAVGKSERLPIVADFEQSHPLAFGLIKQLVYEIYYQDAAVSAITKRRTGFDASIPLTGVAMETNDDLSPALKAMAERPSLVRRA
jgi:hypothetical protein